MMNTTVRHTRFRSQSRHTALAAGLLTLFLFYFVGGSLFTHAHFFDNYTVVHSHYYAHPWQTAADATAAGATPGHSHSAEQLKTLQHLDYLIFVMAATALVCAAFRRALPVFIPRPAACPAADRPSFTTRGPPAGR